MTVTSNCRIPRDFTSLNRLRPLGSRFAEVVSIELCDGTTGKTIGSSKRKSIHVPPSSNAFWNTVNLRSSLVEFFNSEGISRGDRRIMSRLLNLSVRCIHRHELELTYGWVIDSTTGDSVRLDSSSSSTCEEQCNGLVDRDCIQYYRATMVRSPVGFHVKIARMDLDSDLFVIS